MTAHACQQALHAAAVAVLTREPPERDAAAHFEGCADCRAEVRRLAEVGDRLAVLRGAGGTDGVRITGPAQRPPAELLDRVLAAAASRRRRRRVLAPLAAAAAVLAVTIPAGIWIDRQGQDAAPPAAAAPSIAPITLEGYDPGSHLSAKVRVVAAAQGSTVSAEVTGLASGTECTVRVVTSYGKRETVATWRANYSPTGSGAGSVSGSVPVPPSELTGIEFVDAADSTVLLKINL